MLFRQLYDHESSTYTYLLASAPCREALINNPVKGQVHLYVQLINELGLIVVSAIDTHTHADHVTGLGDLRDQTHCSTIMGEYTKAECVSMQVKENDLVSIDGIKLRALYTPGHTDESFSYVLNPDSPAAVFSGDVLLIRGTGRTDFQNGDPEKSWDSIVNKLFRLPNHALLYPAHDYKGCTSSSIAEERSFNPRLAGKSKAEYIQIMNNLSLPNPKLMDVAVPANLACGQPHTY